MAVSLLPGQVLCDMLGCMGLGLILAAVHMFGLFLLGKSHISLFFLDLFIFALAAVILQGYAAGQSLSGIPRGYMAASMLAGAAAGYTVIAPFTEGVRFWLCWLISRPFVLLKIAAGGAAGGSQKQIRKILKKAKNQLKSKR